MITLISPAKLLDFKTKANIDAYSMPQYLEQATEINNELKKLNAQDLVRLQGTSIDIANTNVDRNLLWHPDFTTDNAKQAIFAFNGPVYGGINVKQMPQAQIDYLQEHLRILSGLYGILRPLDLMQPYRLEMGTKLPVGKKKDLYDIWKEVLTAHLNELLDKNNGILINLASKEYFKVLDKKKLNGRIITPEFKNMKNEAYKTIVIYTKQARGMMCRFMAENDISDADDLRAFDMDGYYFNNDLSRGDNWIFTRDK